MHGGLSSDKQFRLEIGSNNMLKAYFGDGTSWGDTSSGHSSSTLSPNKWYHAVAILDAQNDKAYLYINGMLNTNWIETIDVDLPNSLVIGDYITHGLYNFPGIIDEVKIYNRAISQDEIKRDMETVGVYAVYPSEKLAVCWGAIRAAMPK